MDKPRTLGVVTVMVAAGAVMAACASTGQGGQPPAAGSPTDEVPAPTETRTEGSSPPHEVAPVTVLTEAEAIALTPWTACWGGGCYDGFPVDPLPDAGASDALYFTYPDGDWEWEAVLTMPGECGTRHTPAPVEAVSENVWKVLPAGPAGEWTLELFGRGSGGDAVVSVVWTTTSDGPVAPPTSTAVFLADHDGVLDSYGVELGISGLDVTPQEVSATITVTALDGSTLTATLVLPEGWLDCSTWSEEGAVWLSAPPPGGGTEQSGKSVLDPALGWSVGPEYTYTVDLEMDGEHYVGTGTWPSGTTQEDTLSVTLSWEPALPGWDGERTGDTGN